MKERYIAYLFLLCLLIYLIQTVLPILHNVALLCGIFVLIISVYYANKSLKKYEIKGVFISILILSCSYFVSYIMALDYEFALNYYIKLFLLVNLIFFPTYYFSIKSYYNDKLIISFFIILIILYSFYYYMNLGTMIEAKSYLPEVGLGDVVNNVGYNFVTLLPIVLLINNKIFKIIILSLITLLVLYSSKRGAIITVLISLFYIIKVDFQNLKISNNKIINFGLLCLVLLFCLNYLKLFFIEHTSITNRFEDLFNGDSSGRDYLIKTCLNAFFQEDNIFRYFCGYGLGSTINKAGNLAHNDWIETLMNNGFIGVFALLYYYFSLLHFSFKCKVKKYKNIIFLCFVILFLRTLFSQSFAELSSMPLLLLLAYCLAKDKLLWSDKICNK